MAVHNAQIHEDVAHLNRDLRIAIVASEFNDDIMSGLIQKNIALFTEQWFEHIDVYRVPGCFELPPQAKQILEKWVYNMVIVLWCVIRWHTPHFEYVCTESSRWLMDLGLHYDTPQIFGILTCDTLEQAQARVDNNYGIYALNYLAQHGRASQLLDERYDAIMQKMEKEMEKLEGHNK